jgi:hypothetical protein
LFPKIVMPSPSLLQVPKNPVVNQAAAAPERSTTPVRAVASVVTVRPPLRAGAPEGRSRVAAAERDP